MKKAGMVPVRVRTGKGSLFFMTSLQRYCSAKWNRTLPGKKLIERLIVRPLTLMLGHLGCGNEITMYAVRT